MDIHKNETWNTCPQCYKKWKDEIPTQRLLHRTKYCSDKCKKEMEREIALSQPEDLDE